MSVACQESGEVLAGGARCYQEQQRPQAAGCWWAATAGPAAEALENLHTRSGRSRYLQLISSQKVFRTSFGVSNIPNFCNCEHVKHFSLQWLIK